ncbi:MAG: SUMF1/EgtB/PvdO family nonheme iron enzyme, partial [Fibrobacteria bacterium]|nr:SUMF1/EgtB/PvdO family nonheme iron enzyme [Fibrobacteria bacterium]
MKKTTMLTISLTLLCLVYGYSGNINLKGRVVDENDIAQNLAVVTLLKAGVSDTTNDNGEFHLQQLTTGNHLPVNSFGQPEIIGGTVSFSLPVAQQVSLVLLDMNGRVLKNIHQGVMQKGCHDFAIPLSDYASGIYLVKLQMGTKSYISKVYSGLSQTNYRYPVSDPPSLLKVSVVNDTIIITKNGYDDKIVEVSAYVGGLPEITLTRGSIEGMVLIPAKDKSFQMGSEEGDATEMPVHTVTFTRNFWMDKTEVTQGEYSKLMKETYSKYFDPDWKTEFGIGPDLPVYEVNWYDAVTYCNVLSKQDGFDTVYSYKELIRVPGNDGIIQGLVADFSKNGYRLPTE